MQMAQNSSRVGKKEGASCDLFEREFQPLACCLDFAIPMQVQASAGAFAQKYPDAASQISSKRELQAC